MKLTFENKIYAGFAISGLTLAVVFYISFIAFNSYKDTINWVEDTYRAIETVNKIAGNIKGIEKAQRTFILTGWVEQLDEFSKSSEEIFKQIEKLDNLTEDEPFKQAKIDSLIMLVNERIYIAQTVINIYQTEGFLKARELVLSGRGELLTNKIIHVIEAIEFEKKKLLTIRTDAENAAMQRVIDVILIIGIISLIILLSAFFIVKREFQARKKIEVSLRLNNEIMSNMSDAVYLIRASDGIIVYTSPQFEKLFGYDSGELIGKPVSIVNAITDKNPEETALEIIKALNETGTWHGEVRNVKKDGTTIWCDASVTTSSFDEYGPGPVWISSHRDITERKIAEEKLREQEFLLSESQRIGSIGSWSVDLKTNAVTWSPETYKLYGVSEESFLPTQESLLSLLSPDDRTAMQNWIAACIQGKNPEAVEITIKLSDGKERILSGQGEVIYDENNIPVRIVGTVQDITKRKWAEDALRESERKLKEAQRIGRIGSWEFDFLTNQITWSEQVHELYERDIELGVPTEEEEARYYTLEQAKMLKDMARQSIEEGLELSCDFEPILSSGRKAFYSLTMRPVKDENGKIVKLFGTVQDITERKQAEELLRESETRFKATFNQAAVGIAHVDLHGRFIRLNEKFCDIVGYTHDEIITKTSREITHPDDLETDLANVKKVLSGEIKTYSMEKRYFKKDTSVV